MRSSRHQTTRVASIRSADQGKTFEQVSSDESIRTRPFYYGNIDVDPQNPDVVYSMATVYKKSVDGGRTWERLPVPHEDNHDMWINPDNPDLFIQSNDGGANVTHNGGRTWSTQFNQPTAELYQVEVDDQYPVLAVRRPAGQSTTIATPSMPPFRAQDPAAWLVDAGGCETGPAVPKPGDHNIVYANCKGRFGVFDKRVGTEKEYYVGAAIFTATIPGTWSTASSAFRRSTCRRTIRTSSTGFAVRAPHDRRWPDLGDDLART